jgi:hypothetical protein
MRDFKTSIGYEINHDKTPAVPPAAISFNTFNDPESECFLKIEFIFKVST